MTLPAALKPSGEGATVREARMIFIRGAVQGVGFRPFVARLAAGLGIDGWVRNDRSGVTILASGERGTLAEFSRDLRGRCPPAAAILGYREQPLGDDSCDDALGGAGFQIVASEGSGPSSAVITPDLATCADCLRETLDPDNRRFRYPFTNCTQCGPRFSILRRLPYDRPQTTMAGFTMCPACQAEYDSPLDRRYHAQPNACPDCGPRLALLNAAGETLDEGGAGALRKTADRLRAGEIVALKGIGGFHLLVDARNEIAVSTLRKRKRREEKPLAVMFPAMDDIAALCELSAAAEALLQSVAAPIVLLRKRPGSALSLAPSVAPGHPLLGCFLPYSPLHHLLLRECGSPLVATSGNVSDEPICVDNQETITRLQSIADVFLVHDRSIARPVDDSVVRVAAGRTLFLRRSRGYAPLPVTVPGLEDDAPDAVATGAHLKNTVALRRGADLFLSQHLGDLDTVPARAAQREALDALLGLYDTPPGVVACDLHPDYASTRLAEAFALEQVPPAVVVRVQHHHAHLAACLADNDIPPGEPVLGAIWDGTGYGLDRTVWGGEFLLGNARDFERIASLRPFRLPAGERATREPRLSALGLLHEWLGPESWDHPVAAALLRSPEETRVLRQTLARGLNCPTTTSIGRLFDGVAALLGLHLGPGRLGYEGQAAVALEDAAAGAVAHDARRLSEVEPLPWRWLEPDAGGNGCAHFDFAPALSMIFGANRSDAPSLAARFHRTLVDVLVAAAGRLGQTRLALSGGCFQNVLLLEGAVCALQRVGVAPILHRALPPNDGAIAAGQLVVAAARALPV